MRNLSIKKKHTFVKKKHKFGRVFFYFIQRISKPKKHTFCIKNIQKKNYGGVGVGQEPYEQGLTLFIEFQLVHPYALRARWEPLLLNPAPIHLKAQYRMIQLTG